MMTLDAVIDYSRTQDRFGAFSLRSPISLCYQISKYCNYSCGHCLSSSGKHADRGPPTEVAFSIIDEISRSGVKRVNITGGEPFLRGDLPEICKHASSSGLDVVITTNGSIINKKFIENISRCVKFVQISVDGPKQLNDKLRHPGSFDRAIETIKLMKALGLEVRINCTLQRQNSNVVDFIVELAGTLGVNAVYFIVICAQGRASADRDLFCFETSYEEKINKRIKSMALVDSLDVKVLDFRRYAHSCVLVDPNGELISQGWAEEDCISAGNIVRDGLQKCWAKNNTFDHLLHLVKNIRHPLLYT